METAAIVWYSHVHLHAFKKDLGLSNKTKRYATKNVLPLEILSEKEILPALRSSWKDLPNVQKHVWEHRSKYIYNHADALASQMKTDQSETVHQITAENATKSMFRCIRPISKGIQRRQSLALKCKLTLGTILQPATNSLSSVLQYSHSQEHAIDGRATIFRIQTTQKPIPSNKIFPANIETLESGIAMQSYDKLNKNIWREVADSEELVSLLLEWNTDHLHQATLDGTPFAKAPLK